MKILSGGTRPEAGGRSASVILEILHPTHLHPIYCRYITSQLVLCLDPVNLDLTGQKNNI